MLELFSRKPDILDIPSGSRFTPIPFNEEASSLSAILLDDEYYVFIKDAKNKLKDAVVLPSEYIIPLKMKAYLDLADRKAKGQHVDLKDINKHKNDVIRLYRVLSTEVSVKPSEAISRDIQQFLEKIQGQNLQLSNLGIKRESMEIIISNLKKIYNLI